MAEASQSWSCGYFFVGSVCWTTMAAPPTSKQRLHYLAWLETYPRFDQRICYPLRWPKTLRSMDILPCLVLSALDEQFFWIPSRTLHCVHLRWVCICQTYAAGWFLRGWRKLTRTQDKKTYRVASAYILPKLKKDFSTTRSIITYHNAIASPLLSANSWLLIDISKQVFHKAFGGRTVYQIWRQVHKAFDKSHNFFLHNDDLVGFFISFPQARILEDVDHIIDWALLRTELAGLTNSCFERACAIEFAPPAQRSRQSSIQWPAHAFWVAAWHSWHCSAFWLGYFSRLWSQLSTTPWCSDRQSDLTCIIWSFCFQNWTLLGTTAFTDSWLHYHCTLCGQSTDPRARISARKWNYQASASATLQCWFLQDPCWTWTC